LEAAILEHLAAAGNNFARSLAEFKKANGGIDAIDNPFESGSVLENAWAIVASELDGRAHAEFFENIEKGDFEEVQLYVCVGVNVKDMCALYKGGSERPLHWAALHNRLEIAQYFVKSGHKKNLGVVSEAPPTK